MSDASPSLSSPQPEPRRSAGFFEWKQWLFAGGGAVVAAAGVFFSMQLFEAAPVDASAASNTEPVAAKTNEKYVARVGEYLVKRSDLAEECLDRHAKDVLENLINRVIIHQACQRHGIEVTAAEVDQELVRIAKRFDLPVDTWLKMLETEREITTAQYRRDIIWPMLALKKLAAAEGERFTVDQQEMDNAFQRDYGPRVQAKMIMLENMRRAEEVWKLAQQDPSNFERLAREYSVESNSRALGGQIPPIRKHLKVPYQGSNIGSDVLWKKAFQLREGEVSSIIQLGRERYVILLSEGTTEPIVENIADVSEELRKQIVEEKIQRAVARVFDRLKRETHVDNYITRTSSGGTQQASVRQEADDAGNRVERTAGNQPGTAAVGR